MSPFIAVTILLSGFLADIAITEMVLQVAVHSMIRQITQTYFKRLPCIVIVSEKTEPLYDVNIDDLFVMRIVVGEKSEANVLYIEDNNTTDTYAVDKMTQEFENLLQKSLDAGCQGYIVQIPNPKAIVYSFSRTVARTVQRVPRSYVFLPSVKTKGMDKFAEEVLNLKDLDLMPNILIAKIHTSIPVPVSLEEALSLRKLYCTDTSLQIQGHKPGRTEEVLQQGRKFIENLSLNFKQKKSNQITRPKLTTNKQNDTNNMVLAIEIVTQSYVGLNPSKEVFLDIWMQFRSEGFFVLCADLYPDKILDLQGKPLTAATIPYDPFVILYDDQDPPIYDGIEYLIFKELTKKLNSTIKVIHANESLWGAISKNGTGNGIYGAILSGDADVGFAAFYPNWYYEWHWTDYSFPHSQSSPILVVPRPQLLPAYIVPVLPFSPWMWAAVLLSVVVISICISCLSAALHKFLPGFTKKRTSLTTSFLDTLGMFVLQVPNEQSEESGYSPWKHFMTWMLMYFLLISSVYSGGLASILTVPRYERPIDTLEELAASDLNWTFTFVLVTGVIASSDDPILNTIVEKFYELPSDEITPVALKGEDAIHIEELIGGAFSYGPYITIEAMSKLRLMKEPLALAHVVLVTRKGGPYTKPFNQLILRLNQGGLGYFWQADVVRRFLSGRLQLQISLSRTELDPDADALRTLTLSHVTGAFMLLAIGLAASAVAFITELAIQQYKKKTPLGSGSPSPNISFRRKSFYN